MSALSKHKQGASRSAQQGSGAGVVYLLRKSALARLALYLLGIALAFIVLSLPAWHFHAKPEIQSISPDAGVPGDTIAIRGHHFGESLVDEDGSYQRNDVEIGGYALTQSAYLKWTDSEIVVRLPMNVQTGPVFVRTVAGVSNGAFFSNVNELPVPVTQTASSPPPVVSSLSAKALFVGDMLTISGSGFGGGVIGAGSASSAQERTAALTPRVFFEAAGARLRASSLLGDIESWNDNEIKVHVTDGATSGLVTVGTANGTSEGKSLVVRTNGVKYYGDSRTYAVRLAADVSGLGTDSPSHIRLYFPRPVISAMQTKADMTECIPNASDEDYQGTSLMVLQAEGEAALGKKYFQEDYAITVRAMRATVSNPAAITARGDMNPRLFDAATRADDLVPAADAKLLSLAKEMAADAKGTYNTAWAIYNKMLDRFRLLEVKADDCEPLAMLERGSGDAYDFAVIYTALLRAAGVPSLPCSGVIVDAARRAKPHWWSVFYVSGLGWVPVDAALAAQASKAGREAYFARLDAGHIAFSCGYQNMKSALSRSNVVQRPKSYALQSIWEESTKETRRYSSLWADPVVVGVY